MVRTAKQIQKGFFVVFARALQGGTSGFQISFKVSRHKALLQHIAMGQLVDDAGVLYQISGRPFGCTQQAQKALVHGGPL